MSREGEPPEESADRNSARFVRIAKYAAIGIQFPSTIFAGLVVGYLLDGYFGTAPWLLVAMAFGGFFVAVAQLIQWVRRLSKENS